MSRHASFALSILESINPSITKLTPQNKREVLWADPNHAQICTHKSCLDAKVAAAQREELANFADKGDALFGHLWIPAANVVARSKGRADLILFGTVKVQNELLVGTQGTRGSSARRVLLRLAALSPSNCTKRAYKFSRPVLGEQLSRS